MSQFMDRQVLVAQAGLREKQLARIERQFDRLYEKLDALEARLPELDEESPSESIRRHKPR